MKTHWGGVKVQLHAFLTSALDDEWSASLRCLFTPLGTRLGLPQSRPGHSGKERNPTIAPTGNRTPVIQLVV
jgi:hypothetical protein